MPSYFAIRALGLFVVAVVLSGCSFWSWPYPRVVEDRTGLGDSPIGNFFRKTGMALTEESRRAGVVEFIETQTSGKRLSRKDAESLGFQCAPAPRTECIYSGELWHRIERISPDSPHYGMRTVVNIQVHFSYLKPRDVVVQVDQHDIPDE